MPQRAKDIISSGQLTILCGVTASGKNTIANFLVSHGLYDHVVSHTTRSPRENNGVLEQNGREYWFVSNEEMLKMVQNKEFIEVKSIHGQQISGTSIRSIEKIIKNGKHPVMEIEVQGVCELTNVVPDLRPLFVLPPSFNVWMERLGTRGNISDGERERRLRSASMEIRTALDHNAFIFIVNHEVEITAGEIMRGLDGRSQAQQENRKLAEELLDTIRNF
jgi:guanylate kinase